MPHLKKVVWIMVAGIVSAVSLRVSAQKWWGTLRQKFSPTVMPVEVNPTSLPEAVSTAARKSIATPVLVTGTASARLGESVQNALAGTHGTYGIVIDNLKTGEFYLLNEHRPYEAGSLYKLWVMAETFEKIQDGGLREDEVLSKDAAALNEEFNIDQEDAEQATGTVTFSVDDALSQMITVSDNEAALLLTDRLGVGSLSNFLAAEGLAESKVGDGSSLPMTSPYDVALFFSKLYRGELASPENTAKMFGILKQQALNDGIPKYLPESVEVAHKTGKVDDTAHDAGVVYGPNGDYVMVALSESDDPVTATERIAEVSQAVYNYFNPGETAN